MIKKNRTPKRKKTTRRTHGKKNKKKTEVLAYLVSDRGITCRLRREHGHYHCEKAYANKNECACRHHGCGKRENGKVRAPEGCVTEARERARGEGDETTTTRQQQQATAGEKGEKNPKGPTSFVPLRPRGRARGRVRAGPVTYVWYQLYDMDVRSKVLVQFTTRY